MKKSLSSLRIMISISYLRRLFILKWYLLNWLSMTFCWLRNELQLSETTAFRDFSRGCEPSFPLGFSNEIKESTLVIPHSRSACVFYSVKLLNKTQEIQLQTIVGRCTVDCTFCSLNDLTSRANFSGMPQFKSLFRLKMTYHCQTSHFPFFVVQTSDFKKSSTHRYSVGYNNYLFPVVDNFTNTEQQQKNQFLLHNFVRSDRNLNDKNAKSKLIKTKYIELEHCHQFSS